MDNLRTYGARPFGVAVIHGGPGAGGEMAPVARELATRRGVLEPIQTATSLAGQIEELRSVLLENADLPVALVGYSWGAWLSFMLAAGSPEIVGKLVLVSSGPFEEKYVASLQLARMSRLSREEQAELVTIERQLSQPATENADGVMARLTALTLKTDAYDLVDEGPRDSDAVRARSDVFTAVWREAAEMRRTGALLNLASKIRCAVVAIHGDYDPHPAAGVREPLSGALNDFRFVELKQCGHTPWLERHARSEFYAVLQDALG